LTRGTLSAGKPAFWKTAPNDWEAFGDYRRALCGRLKKYFLEFLSGIRRGKRDFEIVMTAMDTRMAPQLQQYIGEDTDIFLSFRRSMISPCRPKMSVLLGRKTGTLRPSGRILS